MIYTYLKPIVMLLSFMTKVDRDRNMLILASQTVIKLLSLYEITRLSSNRLRCLFLQGKYLRKDEIYQVYPGCIQIPIPYFELFSFCLYEITGLSNNRLTCLFLLGKYLRRDEIYLGPAVYVLIN